MQRAYKTLLCQVAQLSTLSPGANQEDVFEIRSRLCPYKWHRMPGRRIKSSSGWEILDHKHSGMQTCLKVGWGFVCGSQAAGNSYGM